MLRVYARLALFVLGLVGTVILFAFAFTAAAIVVLIGLVALALIGRPPRVQWTVLHRTERRPASPPLIIDHDPDDLPRP